MKILESHIKNKSFSNIYLIYGEEIYLKNIYEKRLIDSIVDESLKMMNFDTFEGKNINIQGVIDACNTLPFMNEHRLVILKNTSLIYDAKKDDIATLEKYINNLPKTTILIFIEEKIDKKLKIFKTISKIGSVHQMDIQSEESLVKWIINVCNKNNKAISSKEAIYMIRNIGSNMEILLNEINKLISFANEKTITIKDIDSICTKSVESKIFDLINSIANKNVERALSMYKNLIFNKTSPFMVLNLIYRQFKIILQTKHLQEKGHSISAIASSLSLRDFMIKEAISQGKNFSKETVLNALKECQEIDNNIKTGKIQDELAIELLIIKYAT